MAPGMVTTGTFCGNQPSCISVLTLADWPAFAAAISSCPSGLLTATTGIFGLRGRSSRSGEPQIVVQVPQWMSMPGLTAITAFAPHSSSSEQVPGLAKPLRIAILPPTRVGPSTPPSLKISLGSRV